ncbi:MAG: OmpA family protein [Saprospiraceae bacterium]
MNLIDQIKLQFEVNKIPEIVEEQETNVQIALNSTIAALLAAIMLKVRFLDSELNAFLQKLASDKYAETELFQFIFSTKVEKIINRISDISGVELASEKKIMQESARLLINEMRALAEATTDTEINALLKSNEINVKSALPTGLYGILGFQNFEKMDNKETNSTNDAALAEEQINWLPWIIGALLLLVSLWYFKGCGDKVNQMKKVAAETRAKAVADSIDAYKKTMEAEILKRPQFILANGSSITFEKGSVEDQLLAFIQDKSAPIDKNKWFTIEGLNFESSKSVLLTGSEQKLKNLALILQEYPALTIKVGGYTDNVGNAAENKKLSAARAKNVMLELVKLGAKSTQLSSEGYGQEFPIADNATETGKARNRRIDISVRSR